MRHLPGNGLSAHPCCKKMQAGFAGGLHDKDAGFVRFGRRSYDPAVGCFIAPDPAKDTRVDGDLYDYCPDDPVSRTGPTGLKWEEHLHPRDPIGRFTEKEGGTKSSATSLPQKVKDITRLLERPLDLFAGEFVYGDYIEISFLKIRS